MGYSAKVHKGKLCIFNDEGKILGKFEQKDVDSFDLENWIRTFEGEGRANDDNRNGPRLSWSSGIRERKRIAKRLNINAYTWDTGGEQALPEDLESEDDGDEEV